MCPELPYSKSAVWAGRETVDLDIKTLLPLYFTSKAANQDLPRFKENRWFKGIWIHLFCYIVAKYA